MALDPDERLTAEEFAEFLNEREVQTACRRCGVAHWQTGKGGELKGFIPVGTDEQGDFRLSERSVPVQYLICVNCGNVELFATKVVRKWKRDRLRRQQEIL